LSIKAQQIREIGRLDAVSSYKSAIRRAYESVPDLQKVLDGRIDIEAFKKEIDTLIRIRRKNAITTNLNGIAATRNEDFIRISHILRHTSLGHASNCQSKPDEAFPEVSEDADVFAVSKVEFWLSISKWAGDFDNYKSVGIVMALHNLFGAKSWENMLAKDPNYAIPLCYLLSLNDAYCRRYVDGPNILRYLQSGVDIGERSRDKLIRVAANAISGDDFDAWRKQRCIAMLEAVTNLSISESHVRVNSLKGSGPVNIQQMLASMPAFSFDAYLAYQESLESGVAEPGAAGSVALHSYFLSGHYPLADILEIEDKTSLINGQVCKFENYDNAYPSYDEWCEHKQSDVTMRNV
jgi:hypothetical protein